MYAWKMMTSRSEREDCRRSRIDLKKADADSSGYKKSLHRRLWVGDHGMIAGGVAGLNREEDLVGRLISHDPPPPPKAPHVLLSFFTAVTAPNPAARERRRRPPPQ